MRVQHFSISLHPLLPHRTNSVIVCFRSLSRHSGIPSQSGS
jgi:hypothetical protein